MDLEQFKNILASMLETVTEKGKEYAGVAVDKTKAAGRIARLTLEVAGDKESLKKNFAEIGKAYYESHRDNAEGLLAQLCEEVSAVNARIQKMETEITELKAALRSAPDGDHDDDFEEVVASQEDPAAEAKACAPAASDEHKESSEHPEE